jgi:hypothetical protein
MMRIHLWCIAVVAVVFHPVLAAGQTDTRPPDGFEELIDLKAPATWRSGSDDAPSRSAGESEGDKQQKLQGLKAHWKVEEGEDGAELVNDGNLPFLATAKQYGDFELWVDWKIKPGGDSGIYLRGVPQVQIWDPGSPKSIKNGSDKGSGGLWNNTTNERFPSAVADHPPGEWNRMHITMVGPYVTVELNGQTIVKNVVLENYHDRSIPVPARGPIYLQSHGSESRFRNLFIREIDAVEASRRLSELNVEDSSFTPLFDGKSLVGWTGATDCYEIVDGVLRSKRNEIGNIYTTDEFDDFIVRFEFQLPPGGNNGLAIRVPDKTNEPHLDGIELQILDNTAEQYKSLKPYQYHGSAYGLAPALRGYQRPVGEWNYQQVTVRGDQVEVQLNGFQILNVDLAKVRSDPPDRLNHPGAWRTGGHIGFCGHGDPVSFRNIRIKQLQD